MTGPELPRMTERDWLGIYAVNVAAAIGILLTGWAALCWAEAYIN